MKIKNLSSVIAVVLIATLFGFLPTKAQTEIDTINVEFLQQIQKALELSVKLIKDEPDLTLIYKTPIQSLKDQATKLEQQEKDYNYILAVYAKLRLLYEGKNSK